MCSKVSNGRVDFAQVKKVNEVEDVASAPRERGENHRGPSFLETPLS